jgi:hypothetical protein
MSKYKPQNLGLVGTFTPEEYAAKLQKKIKALKIGVSTKAYLTTLIDYMLSSAQKRTALAKELSQWNIKAIRKDLEVNFSEAIQPLFLIRGNVAQSYGIDLGNSPKIEIDDSLSQGVYDFTLIGKGDHKYRFSSKAGKGGTTSKTNTVKFRDVYNLLHEESPDVAVRYRNSWQMKVFERINQVPKGTWNTPIAAVAELSALNVGPFKGLLPKLPDVISVSKGELTESEYLVYNKILRKVPGTAILDSPTGTSVAYASEFLLSKWSEQNPNDWNELFNASMSNVYTMRTYFPNNVGMPVFEIVKPGKYNVKIGIKARGPTATDHKDSLGFEIK